MVVGLAWLIARQEIFARSPVAMAVQAGAVALMIAARITFGRRSFHAAANPTAGGLVTSGPYRFLASSHLRRRSVFRLGYGPRPPFGLRHCRGCARDGWRCGTDVC